jgi:hypothetical protein
MGRRPVDVRFERRERDGGECDQPAITTAQLGILQDVRPAYRNFGLAYRDFGLYPIVPKGTLYQATGSARVQKSNSDRSDARIERLFIIF